MTIDRFAKPALLIVDMQNDFVRVGAPMEVPQAHDTISQHRQLIDRFLESSLQIWFCMPLQRADLMCIVDVRLSLPEPLHLAQSIQHDRRRDRVQPGRKCGIAAERAESVERPDERLLGEILREGIVAREPERQAVHPVYMRVVQRALCGAIPGADAGN